MYVVVFCFFVVVFFCCFFQQFCWCYCSADVVYFCAGILEVINIIFPNDQFKELGVLTVST